MWTAVFGAQVPSVTCSSTRVVDLGARGPSTGTAEGLVRLAKLSADSERTNPKIYRGYFCNLSFQILIKKMICSGKRNFLKE